MIIDYTLFDWNEIIKEDWKIVQNSKGTEK
jgi:hypothetical protein